MQIQEEREEKKGEKRHFRPNCTEPPYTHYSGRKRKPR